MRSISIFQVFVFGVLLFAGIEFAALANEPLVSAFPANAKRVEEQPIQLQTGRVSKKPGPPRCESAQTSINNPACRVSESENLRARGDRSYLQDCVVDFSDTSAIDFLPDDARYTSASAPFWYQNCHAGIWAHVRAAEYEL